MALELEALRLLRPDGDVDDASRRAREALAAVDFPLKDGEDLYPVPDELDPAQRVVAIALAQLPGLDLGDYALPGSARFRRRWLGLDPPGPLERLVDWEREGGAVRWPLWRLWQVLQAEGDEDEAAELVVDPLDRLEVAFEVELGDLSGYLLDDAFEEGVIELVQAAGAAAVPWAEAATAELLALFASGQPTPESNHAGAPSKPLRIAALLPLAAVGRPLPEAALPWVPVSAHGWATHTLVASLPEARRIELILAQLGAEFSRQRIWCGLNVLEVLPAPEVAAVVAEAMKDRQLRAMGPEWMAEQKRRLAALAEAEPEVMRAVRATGIRLPSR